jgi:TATA-box binding protein (TBP) (component of TFIID and TFIIIB)
LILIFNENKKMDFLTGIDGANYSDQEKNDTYNIHTIAPIENMWFMLNNVEEKRELLLSYVNKYRQRIREHTIKNHPLSQFFKSRNHKFAQKHPRIIIGCTVNISALGSTNPCSFQIENIVHQKPKGILVTNRPRNAAVHIRLRTRPSIITAPPAFERFIRENNMAIVKFDEESKMAKKRIVGDRIVRSMKSCHFSPKLLGDMAAEVQQKMQALQMKQQQKQINTINNSIYNLFSFGNKPIDETCLMYYTSRSYVETGAKHPYMAACSMWLLGWAFTCEAIPVTHLASFSIQNIVATYRMPITIDLPRLEMIWGQDKIEYFGSHFPAAIYTIESSVEKLIIEKANIIKQIRKEIVLDNSWKTQKQRDTDEKVNELLMSYDAFMVKKAFDDRFIFEKKTNKTMDNISMDDQKINDKLKKFFKQDMSNMPSEMKNKYLNKIVGGKPVALIYTNGAIVLTGFPDQDVQVAGFDMIDSMLMHFKIRCEEEDNTIANNSSGVIMIQDKTSTSTQLIVGRPGTSTLPKTTRMGSSQSGSSMDVLSRIVRVEEMAKTARSQTKKEMSNINLMPISKYAPQPNQSTEIVPFSMDSQFESRFSALIKRQRKD